MTGHDFKPPGNSWYDAGWLGMYCSAKSLVAGRHPGRLAEFEAAFQPLRTRSDFEVLELREFFDGTAVQLVREQIEALDPEIMDKREFFNFGRLILQDHAYFSSLQHGLTERVSELVQEEVEPGYSFLSLYNNFGKCDLHMDSPFSKWTLDICIEQSCEWPMSISNVVAWPEHLLGTRGDLRDIVLNDPGTIFQSFTHQPGDALLFSGTSQWHYRDRIPVRGKKNFAHLLFFHYFPKGMFELTKPECWPGYFGLPELEELGGSYTSKIVRDFSECKRSISKESL